ncbi:MAG: hypothetical protein JSR78_07585 [Proteobacteria bacterium]|nr:hypothetical protein [Pseudomonadota bacterium]
MTIEIPEPEQLLFGRRSPETDQIILAALAKGHTRRSASLIGGTSYSSFQRWVRMDAAFAKQVTAAIEQGRRVRFRTSRL